MKKPVPQTYTADDLGSLPPVDGDCSFETSDTEATVGVRFDGTPTARVSIDGQWASRTDLKEIIKFLKLVRKGLPK